MRGAYSPPSLKPTTCAGDAPSSCIRWRRGRRWRGCYPPLTGSKQALAPLTAAAFRATLPDSDGGPSGRGEPQAAVPPPGGRAGDRAVPPALVAPLAQDDHLVAVRPGAGDRGRVAALGAGRPRRSRHLLLGGCRRLARVLGRAPPAELVPLPQRHLGGHRPADHR